MIFHGKYHASQQVHKEKFHIIMEEICDAFAQSICDNEVLDLFIDFEEEKGKPLDVVYYVTAYVLPTNANRKIAEILEEAGMSENEAKNIAAKILNLGGSHEF